MNRFNTFSLDELALLILMAKALDESGELEPKGIEALNAIANEVSEAIDTKKQNEQ